MKKLCWMLAVIMLLTLTACDSSGGGAGGGNYQWVLIDRTDHEAPSQLVMDYGAVQFDYSPGDYEVSWNNTGGESWSGRCLYSEPPEVMNVGETVTLNLSMTETENTLLGEWWVECVSSAHFFYQKGSAPSNPDPNVDFEDSAGDYWMDTNTHEEGKGSLETSISAVAPDGKPGNRLHLTLSFQFDDAGHVKEIMRTVYIYELKR